MSDPAPGWVTGNLSLDIDGRSLSLEMTIPEGPVSPRTMLPAFRFLTEALVHVGVDVAQDDGLQITCQAGCGACCRQAVPISTIEAWELRDLVERMPEPKRTEVKARFAKARETATAAGLWDVLLEPEHLDNKELEAKVVAYFGLGIACPFLENESCSIHPERPISCREYLVSSPKERCADLDSKGIMRITLPAKASLPVGRLVPIPGRRASWIPLIAALDWADSHAENAPHRPGPALLREVVEGVLRQEVREPRKQDGPEPRG